MNDLDALRQERDEAVRVAAHAVRDLEAVARLLEYAIHLRVHGENAPGGDETWERFDQMAEEFLWGRISGYLPVRVPENTGKHPAEYEEITLKPYIDSQLAALPAPTAVGKHRWDVTCGDCHCRNPSHYVGGLTPPSIPGDAR